MDSDGGKNPQLSPKTTRTHHQILPSQAHPIRRLVFALVNNTGFLNTKGHLVIPYIYTRAFDFHGNTAPVEKRGLWGVIDKSGEILLDFKYDYISPFSKNGAVGQKGNEWFLINKDLSFLKIGKASDVGEPKSGVMTILINKGFSFLTTEGESIKINNIDETKGISEEICTARRGKYWYYLSIDGISLSPKFSDAECFLGETAAAKCLNTKKWGLISKEFNWILDPKYDGVSHIDKDVVEVWEGDYVLDNDVRYIYRTKNGTRIV